MVEFEQFKEAIWNGNFAAVEAMIENGADVNFVDEGMSIWPPIHYAIEQQWINIVRRLLEAGAVINHDRGGGLTPLVHAIDIQSDSAIQAEIPFDQASTTLVELLLQAGATPTEEAFEVASGYQNDKVLSLLRSASLADHNP